MQAMVFTIDQLIDVSDDIFWVFMRVAAMFSIAPIIGSRLIPMRIRVISAVTIAFVILPTIPAVTDYELFSFEGLMIMLHQLLIGTGMGFILQIVFNSVTIAGESIAMTMGLGFAQMVDPQNGIQVPVISQFYVITITLLFLSLNGHATLIQFVAQSFSSLPIQPLGLDRQLISSLLEWSSNMFIGAVLLALPIIIALLVTNVTMGVMTRAAPQLNIFAVGFPVTILIGYVAILLALPALLPIFSNLLDQAFATMQSMLRLA